MFIAMVVSMMEIGLMIKNKATVYLNIIMEINIMVSGPMIK